MANSLMLFNLLMGLFVTIEDISQWLDYKNKYGLSFFNTVEEQTRFKIFIDNLRSIEEHNNMYNEGIETWEQTITQFAHLTPDEFEEISCYLDSNIDDNENDFIDTFGIDDGMPRSVDWNRAGKVTPVKNQGNCLSCWAFAAIGGMESHYAIKYNRLISFSEQNLVDCVPQKYNCKGCKGGDPLGAYRYMNETGVKQEWMYPYNAKQSKCRSTGGTKIKGYKRLEQNELVMKRMVATVGPLVASLNARYMQFYKKGIIPYKPECPKNRNNHAILITGYGVYRTTAYWIIKNSWGCRWGEKGYFRLASGNNSCGIRNTASYPII